jgi:hypothetical protein
LSIFLKVAQAGEQTRDLLILFIFSFHHVTAEPQRLPILSIIIRYILSVVFGGKVVHKSKIK